MNKTILIGLLAIIVIVSGCVQPAEKTTCWRVHKGGYVLYDMIATSDGMTQEMQVKMEILDFPECPQSYGGGDCTEIKMEVYDKNSEKVSSITATAQNERIGNYITLGATQIYFQELHEEIQSVCESNTKLSVTKNGLTFELEKVKDKQVSVEGKSIDCCELKTEFSGVLMTFCIAQNLCDTALEMEVSAANQSSKMILKEYN